MNEAQFEQLKKFVENAADYDHIYGNAVVLGLKDGTMQPMGTAIINCTHTKGIDYFIDGINVCGHPYANIQGISLRKRLIGDTEYSTFNI